tara:strand:- start:4361 stop:5128 length:768 start_codon:yes stop_codon:yes gene_type:complete
MTGPPKLTATIVAMNEADRIGPCLASVAFCDEIVVVDSHSTDETRELAAAAGAVVIERDWPGFGPQKDHAAEAASHDWILQLDADERVTPELRAEIEALRDQHFAGHVGWTMPRCSNWFGRWIRHGSWYPDRQLRLYDRRAGHWEGAEPHPKVKPTGQVGSLAGDLQHEPYRNLSEHLKIIDKYTTVMAEGLVARNKKVGLLKVLVNPVYRWFRFVFLQRGFLDGWRGWALAGIEAHYVQMKYLKAYLLQRRDQG